MNGHAIVCGWGRVGRAVGSYLAGQGAAGRGSTATPAGCEPYRRGPAGDVTDDDVLRKAGLMRAGRSSPRIDTDAENVYVTLSARARARPGHRGAGRRGFGAEAAAGRRDRVVNPQRIGGQRIAAAALQPNVVEFLDVVMHDGSLEFRLEEVPIRPGSRLAGRTLRDADLERLDRGAGARATGQRREVLTNPPLHSRIEAGSCSSRSAPAAAHRPGGGCGADASRSRRGVTTRQAFRFVRQASEGR